MSVIITEDRIKKILSNREKMLNDINKKMVLLFREVSRSDMGVFMDELIAEKSISAAHNSLLPGPKGGKKKDLSDLIIKLEKDREIRRKELLTMLTELSNQEDVVNRVWACYLALDDPYYTLLSQLYVENDLYENVRIQFDMSPTTFERYRKKALHLIIEYTKSPLSVGELITGSSGKIHKPQKRAPAGRVPSDSIEGQIDMMDFLEVPDSGTGNEKEEKHVRKQEI